jgi:hypothetical protein
MTHNHSTEPASTALLELANALADAGITLPSLGLEYPPAWVGTGTPPLIDLGRCTIGTAHRLAIALKGR